MNFRRKIFECVCVLHLMGLKPPKALQPVLARVMTSHRARRMRVIRVAARLADSIGDVDEVFERFNRTLYLVHAPPAKSQTPAVGR